MNAVRRTRLAAFGGGAAISRIDRPHGPVTIAAAEQPAIAARINLLARGPVADAERTTMLKQCLAPDYFTLILPGTEVTLPGHLSQTLLLLELAPDILDRIAEGDWRARFERFAGRIAPDRFLTGLVEQLDDADGNPQAKWQESVIGTLVLALLRPDPARGPRAGGLAAWQLARLREHVEAALDRPLPNAELAALVRLSPFHFARAFKRSMGLPPGEWIRLRRLTVAQRLLATEATGIAGIAARVGYDSPSRFARAFRNAFGMSPSAYRAQLRTDSTEAR